MHSFLSRFSAKPLLATAAALLLFATLLYASPTTTPAVQPGLGSSAPVPATMLAFDRVPLPSNEGGPSEGTDGWTAWSG